MDKLTEEQKRIKLAEWVGWVLDDVWLVSPYEPNSTYNCIPNYFHDLNAVAKLEEKMDDDQLNRMVQELYKLPCRFWRASASQRSEAIGVTLGLWKEGQ